jgi:hypothetical protein
VDPLLHSQRLAGKGRRIAVPSQFAWLDYSENERRQAQDVVRLFQDKGTVDELGIGTVRDALADYLFPGISTIQTRARYFLFIPWIHLGMEQDKIASSKAPGIGRHREVELIKALLKSDDHEGLIGRESKTSLQRLPSAVYWAGLQVLGMRRYLGSREQYYRSLDNFYRTHHLRRTNAEDGIAEAFGHQVNWHESLPAPPKDFLQAASLDLTRLEAEYMQQQILAQVPGSMLAFTVDQPQWEGVDYPWLHPNAAEVMPELAKVLNDARNFSLVMHGAAILYNLLMAEKRTAAFSETNAVFSPDRYREAFADWVTKIDSRLAELQQWSADLKPFWQTVDAVNPRIHPFTKVFIESWLEIVLQKSPAALADNNTARDLIKQRERRMKGNRARLSNPRALELWGGESGTSRLSYRWGQGQTIVTDILQGLARNA